ncbi:DNA-processing protein DprA [Dactylosporangium sp. CA-092794]|uniref:DNA-processing protein DprA n=1 Tax=Dactylosporangium sp. CA-092794 TaxID=3239929 RepID=UPI003D8A444B
MMAAIDEVRAARATLAGLAHDRHPQLVELIATDGPLDALARLADRNLPSALLRVLPDGATGGHLREQAAAVPRQAARAGARVVIPQDDEWPARLPDLATAPGRGAVLCLWVRSNPPHTVSDVLGRAVAVVGARAATSYGMHVAGQLGADLAGAGWSVVSTGGLGVDAAALRGALAAGGTAVAVLPSGVDRPHPHANTDLLEQVAREGMLVSPWPPATRLTRARYIATAALVAALTAGTVLVEAGGRSRALTVVRHAIELGRPTMVVPGPVTSVLSDGAHQTLRAHSQARLVRGSTDVLADLTTPPTATSPAA